MKLTDRQLADIQEYASLYMTITDIAILIDVDIRLLRDEIQTVDSPVYVAYRKGKISAKLELHRKEKELASLGLTQAIENCQTNLLNMEDDEL